MKIQKSPKSKSFQVDSNFLRQVYSLTWIGGVFVTPILVFFFGLPTGVSFGVGSIVSFSMLAAMEFVVCKTIDPSNSIKKGKWLFAALTSSKYIFLLVLLFFLIRSEWLNIYALTAGITLAQLVIMANAVFITVRFFVEGIFENR
ncbi:hypothetical protein CMK20_00815 [Candidatus Poribacteria bacterium]|nr:hypothetical protein [Candidatus Poribacteria bacterium]